MALSVVYIGSGAAPAAVDKARAEHERIVAFWTPERVAQAVPRDFVFEPGKGFRPAAKPDKPGKPGGGGDSGSDIVLGSSWNGGGEVLATTGKVLFSMSGSYYVCSASVVDDSMTGKSLVLTAAHCVFDESGTDNPATPADDRFASNWMFIPEYDKDPAPLTANGSFCADTTHGCWTASALVVHAGYTTAGGFNDQATVYDFAFAVMELGGIDGNVLVESLDTQSISFGSVDNGFLTYAFGYPAAQKYKGNDLVYCKGPLERDPYNNDQTYRLGCKMTGGSSGGPWLKDFAEGTGTGTLMSVNSYGYSGVQAMHGPIFNGDTFAVYESADDPNESGNRTVP